MKTKDHQGGNRAPDVGRKKGTCSIQTFCNSYIMCNHHTILLGGQIPILWSGKLMMWNAVL